MNSILFGPYYWSNYIIIITNDHFTSKKSISYVLDWAQAVDNRMVKEINLRKGLPYMAYQLILNQFNVVMKSIIK